MLLLDIGRALIRNFVELKTEELVGDRDAPTDNTYVDLFVRKVSPQRRDLLGGCFLQS